VKVSKEWIANPLGQWTRLVGQVSPPCGHPQSPAHGVFRRTKQIAHAGTNVILPRETPLVFECIDIHEVLHYVVKFLCLPKNAEKMSATIYKKEYLEFLNSVMMPRTKEPVSQACYTLKKDIGGHLKLWLKTRWSSDRLESFIDGKTEFSIVKSCSVRKSSNSILGNSEAKTNFCFVMNMTWSIMGNI
jgi:hypothetical protein